MKAILSLILFLVLGANCLEAQEIKFKTYGKAKIQERVTEIKKRMVPFALQLSNARVSNVYPDSISDFRWNGASWDLDMTYKVTWGSGGRIAAIAFYDPMAPGIPLFTYNLQYNNSGRLTMVETQLLFPVPMVAFRFTQSFDAQGNLTAQKFFENDGVSLVFEDGDSINYIYNGGNLSQAIYLYYSGTSWMQESRLSNLTMSANNRPSQLEIQDWDMSTNNWSTDIMRASDIVWGPAFQGIWNLFDMEEVTSAQFFEALPSNAAENFWSPISYILSENMGSGFVNLERLINSMSGSNLTSLTYQEWVNSAWVSYSVDSMSYTANNRLASRTSMSISGGVYLPSYRETFTYTPQNFFARSEYEFWGMNGWEFGGGQEYAYQLASNNIPFDITYRYFDMSSNGYVNEQRMVYTFGGFNTSVNPHVLAGYRAYPNPVVQELTLEAPGSAQFVIRDLQGRLVLSGNFEHQLRLDASQLNAGMYIASISSEGNMQTLRVVKQ